MHHVKLQYIKLINSGLYLKSINQILICNMKDVNIGNHLCTHQEVKYVQPKNIFTTTVNLAKCCSFEGFYLYAHNAQTATACFSAWRPETSTTLEN